MKEHSETDGPLEDTHSCRTFFAESLPHCQVDVVELEPTAPTSRTLSRGQPVSFYQNSVSNV